MVSGKGMQKVTGDGKGKRKWRDGKSDDEKSGQKQNNRDIVPFFEVNDNVRVLDGSLKESGPVPSSFSHITSSSKTPLSPDKSFQKRDGKTNYKRDDGMYYVGQSVRIRVGPLKGYMCRVIGFHRSHITVKLYPQHRILDVKSEHLCEVRGRNPATAQGSYWSTFPSSSSSFWKGSGSADPADNDSKKGTEDSSWGAAAVNKSESGQADGWGKPAELQDESSGGWAKPVKPQEDNSGGWGRAAEKISGGDTSGLPEIGGWGKAGGASFQTNVVMGGRGSDREGYRGGRGKGFRGGRGGFRGRERGDWNNREDNSNQDKSNSWGRRPNNDSQGWKSSSGGGSSCSNYCGDNGGGSGGWGSSNATANKDDCGGSGGWGSSDKKGGW